MKRIAVLWPFSLLSLPSTALAQSAFPHRPIFFDNARLLSWSDAQRALASGNDTIYLNPAGMALSSAYSVEGGYLDDLRGTQHFFNASIMDSQEGPVAGGIAYTYQAHVVGKDDSGNNFSLNGHRVEIALATRIAETAAIGIDARYLNLSAKDGNTALSGDGISAFTVDAGFKYRALNGLAIGAAGYNLTNSTIREMPRSWGAGLGWDGGNFSVEGDVRYNTQIGKARFELGASYAIGGVVPIRLSGAYDLADQSGWIGGGVGFVSKEIGADIGLSQRIVDGAASHDADDRLLGIALRLIFL